MGRGAPKGGIRLPAPRRRSVGAALRVQLRAKGPEAHAAYATEQALSPSRTREKVHALCLRPPENIRPPCALAPRNGGRRCAFCMLSVSRANVAAKRRKGEEPPCPPSKYARERPARHCGRTVLRACQTIPRLPAEKYPGDRTPTLKVIPQAIGVSQFPWSRNTDRKYPDHPGGVTVDPRRLGPTVTPPSNRRESRTKEKRYCPILPLPMETS